MQDCSQWGAYLLQALICLREIWKSGKNLSMVLKSSRPRSQLHLARASIKHHQTESKVHDHYTDTTLRKQLISREPSSPLCFFFHFRTRTPPISLSLRVHLLQESLHPLFHVVDSHSTRTSLPIRSSIRNETFRGARRAGTGFVARKGRVEIVS